jgi:uncharacterized membrane protein
MSEVRCRGKKTLVWLALAGACVLASWGIVQAGGKPKPPPPPPPPAYTLQALEVPPGLGCSLAYGVNDRGQVVGTVEYPGQYAAIWETASAAPTVLDNAFGSSCALAINNSAEIAGYYGDQAGSISGAAVWIPEPQGNYRLVDLAPCPRDFALALDINEDGAVAGTASLDDRSVGFVVVPQKDITGNPVCWFVDQNGDGFNDLAYKVEVVQNQNTSLHAINDSGWVVGNCTAGAFRSFLIIPGFDLDNPWWKDADQDGVNDLVIFLPGTASASDVNNCGQIIGDPGATLWQVVVAGDGSVSITQTTLPSASDKYGMHPEAINDSGQVAADGGRLTNGADHTSILWQADAGSKFLRDLVSDMGVFTSLTQPWDISNTGQIVGQGQIRTVAYQPGWRGYVATPAGN